MLESLEAGSDNQTRARCIQRCKRGWMQPTNHHLCLHVQGLGGISEGSGDDQGVVTGGAGFFHLVLTSIIPPPHVEYILY
jgi:hypothetical protein